MLNKICLAGRFTKDAELRRTSEGTAVASFTLAVERDVNRNDVDFIECVAWRNTAEFISKYFAKGSMAICTGRLQIRSWEDKQGNKRKTAEVIVDSIYFGGSKAQTNGDKESSQPASSPYAMLEDDDDKLPF